VASLWTDAGWHIPFRRSLDLRERVEWVNLMREIETLRLADSPDPMSWVLEPLGRFTVQSLYRKLCEGTPSKFFGAIWQLAIPSRIRIFLSQLARKRLPTNANIRHRRGPSTGDAPSLERLKTLIVFSSNVGLPNSCGAQLRNCYPIRGTPLALRMFVGYCIINQRK
jgi:hypothetical protein